MGVVLYGSQYWEDYELWVCLEGMKGEKYIKIGQNIYWNQIGGKILVRNSRKSVLTPISFSKIKFFDNLAISPLFSDHQKGFDMIFILIAMRHFLQ